MRVPPRTIEVTLLILVCLLAAQSIYGHRRAIHLTRALAAAQSHARAEGMKAGALRTQNADLSKLLSHVRFGPSVSLTGVTMEGEERRLQFDRLASPTALFIIDANCGSCYANLQVVKELAKERPCSLSVVGISLNDELPPDKWSRDATEFDVLLQATGRAWVELPLSSPSSILLAGAEGRFGGWWSGGILSDTRRVEFRAAVRRLCDADAG